MKSIVSNMSGSMALFAVLSLAAVSLLQTAYADEAKDVFEQAKLAVELEFSETIVAAKADYQAIINDISSTSEQKLDAREQYNAIVSEAKTLRDQKIADAREQYANAQNYTDSEALAQATKELSRAITAAQTQFQKDLAIAEQEFEQLLAKLVGDDEVVEALEESYEETVAQIKQTFNNAVLSAQEAFAKVKNSVGGS